MTTAVVITHNDDGQPVIRLDRPNGTTARLTLTDPTELHDLHSQLTAVLGGHAVQPTPADPVAQPHQPQRQTRLQELTSIWRWLTAPAI